MPIGEIYAPFKDAIVSRGGDMTADAWYALTSVYPSVEIPLSALVPIGISKMNPDIDYLTFFVNVYTFFATDEPRADPRLPKRWPKYWVM